MTDEEFRSWLKSRGYTEEWVDKMIKVKAQLEAQRGVPITMEEFDRLMPSLPIY